MKLEEWTKDSLCAEVARLRALNAKLLAAVVATDTWFETGVPVDFEHADKKVKAALRAARKGP